MLDSEADQGILFNNLIQIFIAVMQLPVSVNKSRLHKIEQENAMMKLELIDLLVEWQ